MFAITFVFMFGVMFGDVGQGAVFVFLSWLFRKSLGHYIRLTVPLGLSSIFFGFMYGSVFGFEDVIINHIWVSPLHSPTYMLAAGVFWGVAFITMVSMVAIYNHYIEGEIMEAVSGHHGIMSLVLYLSIVWGLVEIANGGEFGTIPKYLAILALSAIAAHTWHEMHDSSVIERIMVVIVGFLEIFMGYISNTLSFLRVAAFSVNHAALAMSVFAIAYAVGNTQTTGHWITVVLGNVFIMVLEGAIVAIQTLRLEYYEGFSRYYNGDGLEYQPIKLNLKAGI
jgi:V/A-type H+-transporting ATPase subunit I